MVSSFFILEKEKSYEQIINQKCFEIDSKNGIKA